MWETCGSRQENAHGEEESPVLSEITEFTWESSCRCIIILPGVSSLRLLRTDRLTTDADI